MGDNYRGDLTDEESSLLLRLLERIIGSTDSDTIKRVANSLRCLLTK